MIETIIFRTSYHPGALHTFHEQIVSMAKRISSWVKVIISRCVEAAAVPSGAVGNLPLPPAGTAAAASASASSSGVTRRISPRRAASFAPHVTAEGPSITGFIDRRRGLSRGDGRFMNATTTSPSRAAAVGAFDSLSSPRAL